MRVDRLDLDALPEGALSRLWVEIGHDGLARSVEVPVLVARGTRPGPTFGLSAAVHGNELNGIPVIHRLMHRLDLDALRGAIAAVVVVNVPGFVQRQRRYLEAIDLNHSFPGRPDGNSAQVYVYRLLERVFSTFDMLVDLHTASFGRVNSLYVRADMTHGESARMAYRQRPDIIVHNPPSDRTLRGAAAERGMPAITLEIGNPHHIHRDYVQRAVVGLRQVLSDHGMVRRRPAALGEPPVLCEHSQWLYTDSGGLLEVTPALTERVETGQVVATLTDPFGDPITEYVAPEAGVVIGRSVDPVAHTGARILHLGRVAAADDPRFHQREEDE